MKYEAVEVWLDKFKLAWTQKDLKAIQLLFDEQVEYWESPFKKLAGIQAVMKEWQAVVQQENIKIETELLTMDANRSTVRWDLSYVLNGAEHVWAGLYLIELNSEQRCVGFMQVGEEKK